MAEIKQRGDGALAIFRETDGKELLTVGGPVTPQAGGVTYLGKSVIKIPLGSGAAATANLGSVLLSTSEDFVLGNTVLQVTTGQSLSLNINVGTGATNSTYANNLLDSVNINPDAAGVGAYDNITDKGTNGKSRQVLSAGQFINITSTRAVASLQGAVLIDAIKV